MTHRTTKRLLAALLAAGMMLSATACSGGGASQAPSSSTGSSSQGSQSAAGSGSENAAPEPISFTMMCNYNSVEPPKKDGMMVTYLKEKLNADVDITWIPTTAYNDKLSAQIASADLPNVVAVREAKGSIIVNSARSGMFWALDNYITPEYNNFDKLNKEILNNLRIDGVLYSLPRERDIARSGVYYRADWLENLGLEPPKNLEDIKTIIKAFTENDPDGDGQKNTTGISMKGKNLGNFLTNVNIYMGGPHEWYVAEDGTVKNEVDSPTYIDSMNFFRDAYKSGYMLSDFTVNTDEQLPVSSGKAGFVFCTTIGDANGVQRNLRELFPDGKIDISQEIATPSGEIRMRAHTGYTGVIMFPKTTTKTEEQLVPILKFFNTLGEDEHLLMLRYGQEGVHYTMENGTVVRTQAQADQYAKDMPDTDQFHPYGGAFPYPVKLGDTLQQKIQDSMNAHVNDVVFSVKDAYISDTESELGDSLADILKNARMQYVLGEIDEAGWQKAVDEWKAAGGDKVAAEFTEQYQAAHK